MPKNQSFDTAADQIPALLPRGTGHQFLLYGDACSGVPGARHEQTFAEVNAIVRRLDPPPEFIVFLGDEIAGLTPDRNRLLAQWRHWLDAEMAWHDRHAMPMWHATGNHTTYDEMSEQVFCEVLVMPRNGPPGQKGAILLGAARRSSARLRAYTLVGDGWRRLRRNQVARGCAGLTQ